VFSSSATNTPEVIMQVRAIKVQIFIGDMHVGTDTLNAKQVYDMYVFGNPYASASQILDPELLKEYLCHNDPGETYSVSFYNREV
jgi:hypothetical protein